MRAVLNLPPLIPVTDATLDTCLSDQVRQLGASGFPLVEFRGRDLEDAQEWTELRRSLEQADVNGGWPALTLDVRPEVVGRAVEEGWVPWGCHLDRADLPVLQGGLPKGLENLHVSISNPDAKAWDFVRTVADHAYLGPGSEWLHGHGKALRMEGIAPVAVGDLSMMDALAWFEAGVESLAVNRDIARSASPAEWLWETQRLRWRVRPLIRRGQGIALVGGSGCGKSTLARKLGRHLEMPVEDLDDTIARRAGRSIPEIFAQEGEAAFRAMETELTCKAFRSPAVLALGGGAWESPAVRDSAARSGYSVLWIAENPDRIWKRVAQDPGRPLAQDRRAFFSRWRVRRDHWMELPMVLPLGRSAGALANAILENVAS